MYHIHCRVWGGMFGSRQSLLKAEGVVMVFETREEAEERARFLNIQMNNAHAVACFEYQAKAISQ